MTVQVLLLTAALTAAMVAPAQVPAGPKPSPDPPADRAEPTVPAFVVVEGCIAAESDIPGRQPNLAERAGMGEDYVLTNAVVVRGKPPVEAPDHTGGAVSNALRPMYELSGVPDDQLKPHLGHRVRIEGTFTNTNRDPQAGPLNDDLVELTGASIRQVPGTCTRTRS